MRLTKRTSDRASELQRSTKLGWYLAVCFTIGLAGMVWLASAMGYVSFGGDDEAQVPYKVAVKDAARKAAEQQVEARLAAEEEARNIAEDAKRLVKAPGPEKLQGAEPSAGASPEAAAPAPLPSPPTSAASSAGPPQDPGASHYFR